MNKLSFQDVKNKKLLLYEYIRGSQAYGTSTPESDEDHGGIYIAPEKTLMGLGFDYQEEILDEKGDTCWWEIGRFLQLALKSNPTVLEALFIPDDKVIYEHPLITDLKKHRDQFLTKRCFKPLGGYMVSQIEKARGQNKKIHWDINQMTRKTPLDFAYTFHKQGSQNIQPWLEERGLDQRNIGLVNIPNMEGVYGAYYDFGQHIKLNGISKKYFCNACTSQNDKFVNYCIDFFNIDETYRRYWSGDFYDKISIPKGGHCGIISPNMDSTEVRYNSHVNFSPVKKGDEPICWIVYNQSAYENHCRKYKEYEEWKQKRNKARYENNLQGLDKKNPDLWYDCYLDSETEFLTSNGWKKYDEVTENDKLGCFNDEHCIEYHHFLNRFEGLYSGEIYTYESPYIRFSVTPNHKLYLSRVHRSPKNHFSTEYDSNTAKWELLSVEQMMGMNRSYYHQLMCLQNHQPDNKEFSDDFIKILGLFLSEGCYEKEWRTHKKRGIRIAQTNERQGCAIMDSIKDYYIRKYVYNYPKRHKGNEYAYVCEDKFVLNKILECGEYSTNKDIPQYVYSFSKRQFDIFLEAMIAGDGSHHKEKGHSVYYTYSPKMAKSLHTLLMLNGYNSQLYGGNEGSYCKQYKSGFKRKDGVVNPTYQVFISKFQKPYHVLNKTKHWAKHEVKDQKIVCFETPHGTLITRNNNKMAFHGNCKNMMHSFRLATMAIEIAKGEGMKVNRTGIDADFLLDVRNRKYTYAELIDKLEVLKANMNEAFNTSTLPEEIDVDFVNDMLLSIRHSFTYESEHKAKD